MIDVNALRKGVVFDLDGSLFKVKDYHHNKTGRGGAKIVVKAQNLRTGANIERTFNSGERIQNIRLDYQSVQYLYTDGELYHFMNNDTFEQPAINASMIEDVAGYLTEGLTVKLTFFENEPLDIELPS